MKHLKRSLEMKLDNIKEEASKTYYEGILYEISTQFDDLKHISMHSPSSVLGSLSYLFNFCRNTGLEIDYITDDGAESMFSRYCKVYLEIKRCRNDLIESIDNQSVQIKIDCLYLYARELISLIRLAEPKNTGVKLCDVVTAVDAMYEIFRSVE